LEYVAEPTEEVDQPTKLLPLFVNALAFSACDTPCMKVWEDIDPDPPLELKYTVYVGLEVQWA
jgi:hypothetical protein